MAVRRPPPTFEFNFVFSKYRASTVRAGLDRPMCISFGPNHRQQSVYFFFVSKVNMEEPVSEIFGIYF